MGMGHTVVSAEFLTKFFSIAVGAVLGMTDHDGHHRDHQIMAESGCEQVFEYFLYCMDFLVGAEPVPPRRCCEHVVKLNRLAKRGLGAGRICWCIECMVRDTAPQLMASRIDALPTMCHTPLSFPISVNMDCSQ